MGDSDGGNEEFPRICQSCRKVSVHLEGWNRCELCDAYYCGDTCKGIEVSSGKHDRTCFASIEDHEKLRKDFWRLSGIDVPGVVTPTCRGVRVLIFPGPVDGDVPPSAYSQDTATHHWESMRDEIGVRAGIFFYLIPLDQVTRVWFLEMTDEQRKTLGDKMGEGVRDPIE